MANTNASQTLFISTDALLEHWQGHRRLTRRVIELSTISYSHSRSAG